MLIGFCKERVVVARMPLSRRLGELNRLFLKLLKISEQSHHTGHCRRGNL